MLFIRASAVHSPAPSRVRAAALGRNLARGGRNGVRFFASSLTSATPVEVDRIVLPESRASLDRKARRRANLVQNSTSLVDASLNELDARSREERVAARRQLPMDADFDAVVAQNAKTLRRKPAVKVFQINIGLYCNQACGHCHVESSPRRIKEQMSLETVEHCLQVIRASPDVQVVDITGGAPELNAQFRHLVASVRAMPNRHVDIIDRCNLTVLSEPGQEDLARFLAKHKVHVIASLPCYGPKNVDEQRGVGVFAKSISGLAALNELGYGVDPALVLDLVYNPVGPFLPPDQAKLELEYKKRLDEEFGIVFNSLFCITNMPIKRFADYLHRRGELRQYMDLLVNNFNPATVDTVMCTDYLSVRHDGRLFDCDFNQQLSMPMLHKGKPRSVMDLASTADLGVDKIRTGPHCFGCTAGKGSSCLGEVVAAADE